MKKNSHAEISAKMKKTIPIPKKARGKGKPFEVGNPYRFPPGKSPNPGGKPREFRLLSEAYSQMIKEECPTDFKGRTWGEVMAEGMMKAAKIGNPAAAKEIRQAMEGDRIRTWQDDVIQALKEGRIKTEDIIRELGDEIAKPIIASAGIISTSGGETSDGSGSEPIKE